MKKKNKSLGLNKFTIAKLNNSQNIVGGNPPDDGTDQGNGGAKCLQTSKIVIENGA
ncbi:class I lanthipeptide [Sinomicrobium sp. M5D2P9]